MFVKSEYGDQVCIDQSNFAFCNKNGDIFKRLTMV